MSLALAPAAGRRATPKVYSVSGHALPHNAPPGAQNFPCATVSPLSFQLVTNTPVGSNLFQVLVEPIEGTPIAIVCVPGVAENKEVASRGVLIKMVTKHFAVGFEGLNHAARME